MGRQRNNASDGHTQHLILSIMKSSCICNVKLVNKSIVIDESGWLDPLINVGSLLLVELDVESTGLS